MHLILNFYQKRHIFSHFVVFLWYFRLHVYICLILNKLAMSRGLLSFSSIGRKAECGLTIYFGLFHCSQLPKKVSLNKLAQQGTHDMYAHSWKTTTKIGSSHTILSLMVGNSDGNLSYYILIFIECGPVLLLRIQKQLPKPPQLVQSVFLYIIAEPIVSKIR